MQTDAETLKFLPKQKVRKWQQYFRIKQDSDLEQAAWKTTRGKKQNGKPNEKATLSRQKCQYCIRLLSYDWLWKKYCMKLLS